MKTIKVGTEVKVKVIYANPTRTRVKHGVVMAVQTQDRLTARIGRQPYAVIRNGKAFDDWTTYGSATPLVIVPGTI